MGDPLGGLVEVATIAAACTGPDRIPLERVPSTCGASFESPSGSELIDSRESTGVPDGQIKNPLSEPREIVKNRSIYGAVQTLLLNTLNFCSYSKNGTINKISI